MYSSLLCAISWRYYLIFGALAHYLLIHVSFAFSAYVCCATEYYMSHKRIFFLLLKNIHEKTLIKRSEMKKQTLNRYES